MPVKAIPAADVKSLIDQIEEKIKKAEELVQRGPYGHAHALGYLEGSVLYLIKQLKGEYPI